MKTTTQLGREIKAECAKRGLKLGEFARSINIEPSTLSHIIAATPNRYSETMLMKVTSALGISLSITGEE